MRVAALLHIWLVGRSGKWIHITSNGQSNVASDLTSKGRRKECNWAEPKQEKLFLWQILKATLISHTKCNRVGARTLENSTSLCLFSILTKCYSQFGMSGWYYAPWWGCIQHPTWDLYWVHCGIVGHSNCLSDPKFNEGVELEIWQDCMLLLTVPQWWYWCSLRSSGLTEAYIWSLCSTIGSTQLHTLLSVRVTNACFHLGIGFINSLTSSSGCLNSANLLFSLVFLFLLLLWLHLIYSDMDVLTIFSQDIVDSWLYNKSYIIKRQC